MSRARFCALLVGCLAASSCSRPKAKSPGVNFGPISIAPTSGYGREQIFRVTLSSPDRPMLVGLLINDDPDGANACYVFHSFTTNEELLVNDNGSGSKPLGNAPALANAQCSIIKDGSTASITNNKIAVSFHIRFKETFRGTKTLYTVAVSSAGGTQGPANAGTWDMWDAR